MIKPMERNKEQDAGNYKDLYLTPEPVIREDGLPTIDQWEKLLGREGVVTGRKLPPDEDKELAMKGEEQASPCAGKPHGVMMVKKSVKMSPLSSIIDAGKPMEDIVEKADNRHEDIVNLVESILRLV